MFSSNLVVLEARLPRHIPALSKFSYFKFICELSNAYAVALAKKDVKRLDACFIQNKILLFSIFCIKII